MKITDILDEIIDKEGGKVIAAAAGIDQSLLSRFRNGTKPLKIGQIQAIFEFSEYMLTTQDHQADLKKAIVTVAGLLKEEMGR